jgi:iron complex outermembrane receptor protein
MIKKIILVAVIAALPLLAQAEHDETIHLDEIGVTAPKDDTSYAVKNSSSATRTDTPIKEIPQSIQVVPRQLIDDQQNVIASEALKNVSSVVTNAEFSPPVFETTRIRGFSAEQLVDGFTQYYSTGDRESLVNVQSLEVLKGSNALLYSGGSGSPVGGVVNTVSKLPQAKAFGELGVKLGTDSFVQPFFDVNQPITENVLLRVTGEYTKAESNVDVIEQKRYNINPSLTLTNNNDTTFTMQGKFSRWKQQDYQGLPATGTVTGSFRIKDDLFIGNKDIPDTTSEFKGLWGTLDHKINETWSFNVKARYAESEFDEKTQLISTNAPDFFPPSTWSIVNTQLYQRQTEQSVLANVMAKFDAGITKNTVLMGVDYSELKDTGFMNADMASLGAVDLSNPVFNIPYADPDPTSPFTLSFSDAKVKNVTHGAYVQLQSTIADRFHLLAGLRQAHVGVNYEEFAPLSLSHTKTDKDKLLPRIGGVFDLNDSLSVFAGYSEGLRGQPFSIFAPGSTPKPAESRNKEAGVKFDVDGKLSGQLALFHTERTNVAVGFPATPTGEQRARGFDADVTWQPSSAWKILANYAYTDAEFTKNASATVLDGNQLSGIPKNSARLWVNYSFPQEMLSGLSAGVGAYWQSEAYVEDANQFKADSYHTFDAALNYQTQRFNLGLTVKNLTNEDYYQYYNYFGGRVRPDSGTSAYLTASFKY